MRRDCEALEKEKMLKNSQCQGEAEKANEIELR